MYVSINIKRWLHNSIKLLKISLAPVTHICNPSYSGGRGQEDLWVKNM
jgi:hypothetical protein